MTAQTLAEPIARLIAEFGKLPTIGPKTAQRLTYFLLRQSAEEAQSLAAAILDLKEKILTCNTCFNLGTHDPCHICTDPTRDRQRICVVEEPLDVLALERTGVYRGQYHVLHGSFSPMDGVLEDDLRIRELVRRVANEPTRGDHRRHECHRGRRGHRQSVAEPAPVQRRAGHSPGPRTTDWLRSGVRRRLHAESSTGGPPRLLGGRGLTEAGMGQAVGAQHAAPRHPRRSGGLLTRQREVLRVGAR